MCNKNITITMQKEMSNAVKCQCGAMDTFNPKKRESEEEFLKRKLCWYCHITGLSKRMTMDRWVLH